MSVLNKRALFCFELTKSGARGVAKPCKITWYFILGVCCYQLCAHTEQLPFLRAVVFPRTGFALGERIRRAEGMNRASLHELRGILLHVESFSWFLFTAAVMVPLKVREPLKSLSQWTARQPCAKSVVLHGIYSHKLCKCLLTNKECSHRNSLKILFKVSLICSFTWVAS